MRSIVSADKSAYPVQWLASKHYMSSFSGNCRGMVGCIIGNSEVLSHILLPQNATCLVAKYRLLSHGICKVSITMLEAQTPSAYNFIMADADCLTEGDEQITKIPCLQDAKSEMDWLWDSIPQAFVKSSVLEMSRRPTCGEPITTPLIWLESEFMGHCLPPGIVEQKSF